ncbi:MAG: ComF family protein [Deltaproteobacteria bacterium]|nr:ComF family protein [Deltaproteobacteria bacterium]
MALNLFKPLGSLLDFFLPRLCVFCRGAVSEGAAAAVCQACQDQIQWVASPLCLRCGRVFGSKEGADRICGLCQKEPPPFVRARAAVLYDEDGPAASAIKQFKYGRRMDMLPVLQTWLRTPTFLEPAAAVDLLVPVPLHSRRLKERGFNQALLLARAFPDQPLARDALVRVRHTVPQSGLNPKERRENVKRAFAVPRAEQVKGKKIILVDDVYTTGATVKECAKVLMKAGAREVQVLTVARVRYE